MSESIVCDFCGKTHVKSIKGHDRNTIGIRVVCGYGSRHDGEILDFCNEKCMVKFYAQETEKIIKKLEKKEKVKWDDAD